MHNSVFDPESLVIKHAIVFMQISYLLAAWLFADVVLLSNLAAISSLLFLDIIQTCIWKYVRCEYVGKRGKGERIDTKVQNAELQYWNVWRVSIGAPSLDPYPARAWLHRAATLSPITSDIRVKLIFRAAVGHINSASEYFAMETDLFSSSKNFEDFRHRVREIGNYSNKSLNLNRRGRECYSTLFDTELFFKHVSSLYNSMIVPTLLRILICFLCSRMRLHENISIGLAKSLKPSLLILQRARFHWELSNLHDAKIFFFYWRREWLSNIATKRVV